MNNINYSDSKGRKEIKRRKKNSNYKTIKSKNEECKYNNVKFNLAHMENTYLDETKNTLSIVSDVTGITEAIDKDKNTVIFEQEPEENISEELKPNNIPSNEEALYNKINAIEEINFPICSNQEGVSINKLQLKDTDNASSVINVHKEDSILQEAKNNIFSPSPSDVEGPLSHGGMSNFFNSSELVASITNFKDLAKMHLDSGNRFRLKANQLFKKNKFKDALGEYLKAVEELNLLISQKNDSLNMTNINWVRMECLNSIAVCFLLLKEYQNVLNYTGEVLNISPNNFIALSYRAKALIAMKNYKEAQDIIKLALSIKYSKSLISLLKQIDEKLFPVQKNTKPNSITTESMSNEEGINCFAEMKEVLQNTNSLTENLLPEKEHNEKGPSLKRKKKHFLFSIFLSIIKFCKIFSIGVFETVKKYKFGLLVLFIIYIIIFRQRLKSKLFSILRIKFN